MQERKTKIWVLLLALLLFAAPIIKAQEDSLREPTVYSLGQQTLAISAGLFKPLFYQQFPPFKGEIVGETNLSWGGVGSLQWGVHLSNHWLLGLEVGGIFSRSVRGNFLFMLPITIKNSYIFHLFPFQFPVFLGVGLNILKYTSMTSLDLILKPGFSTLWKVNINWAFGLNFVYWWNFEFWGLDPDERWMGNFLEITTTAQYSF